MRRTQRTKTVVVNSEDLQDPILQKKDKIQEEKIYRSLKGFVQTKLSISDAMAEEVVKRIFDLIDAVEKECAEEAAKESSQKDYCEEIVNKPALLESKSLTLSTKSQSMTKTIPPEIINSTIRVQDLAQSFENVVDGILARDRCSTTNVSICKNEIIQERTFNFQNLIKMFEIK